MAKTRPRARHLPALLIPSSRADVLGRVGTAKVMQTVREKKSEAIEELLAIGAVDTDSGTLRPDFIRWLKTWKLGPPETSRVVPWAREFFAFHRRHPNRPSDWPPVLYWSAKDSTTNQDLQELDPSEPLEARPDIEGEKQFCARARLHWKSQVQLLKDHYAAVGTPIQCVAERDFVWLVRFNVLDEDIPDIAKEFNVGESTVRAGLKRASQLVGIELRQRRRPIVN